MMKIKRRRSQKVYVKLVAYVFAFLLVVAGYFGIQSKEFTAGLNFWMGHPSPVVSLSQTINWCEELLQKRDLPCKVESLSYEAEILSKIQFVPLRFLIDQPIILEQGTAPYSDYFRSHGLIFRSPELAEKIPNYIKSQ